MGQPGQPEIPTQTDEKRSEGNRHPAFERLPESELPEPEN